MISARILYNNNEALFAIFNMQFRFHVKWERVLAFESHST